MPEDYESYVPVERDGSSGDADSSVSYMIRGLLASRVEAGLSDDDGPPEEDVNVYITHLLCDFLRPAYHERTTQYVSCFDTSVFEQVRHTTNTRFKYTVYRTNADHILMMMGLFQNAEGGKPLSVPEPLRIDDDTHLGRGKTYYDFAFTYSRSLFGRTSAITGVLGKLSAGFERYVRLLAHMRVEYMNLIERMGAGELYHLQREVCGADVDGSTSSALDALRNDFIDHYRAWQYDPSLENLAALRDAARRLQAADPDFRFELPEN